MDDQQTFESCTNSVVYIITQDKMSRERVHNYVIVLAITITIACIVAISIHETKSYTSQWHSSTI